MPRSAIARQAKQVPIRDRRTEAAARRMRAGKYNILSIRAVLAEFLERLPVLGLPIQARRRE
jgi:hypothetical protein